MVVSKFEVSSIKPFLFSWFNKGRILKETFTRDKDSIVVLEGRGSTSEKELSFAETSVERGEILCGFLFN